MTCIRMVRNRRQFGGRASALLAVTASCVLVAACGSNAASGGDKSTIEIGLIGPYGTNLLGQNAEQFQDGVQLAISYMQSHGGILDGAKVDLQTGNDGNTPAGGASAVRSLLAKGVKLFVSTSTTAVTEAMGKPIDDAGAVLMQGSSEPTLVGSKRPFKNLYHAGVSSDMMAQALGKSLGAQFKDTKVINTFGYDYIQGHTTWEALKSAFEEQGINFTSPIQTFVPTTQTNYVSEITSMNSRVDPNTKNLLALLTFGPGYVTFLQEAMPLGLLDKYQATVTTAEYYLEAAAMKGAAPVVWNAFDVCHYGLFDNDIMKWLVPEAKKASGFQPNDWSVQGFDYTLALLEAINKAGSADPAKVMSALDGMTMNLAVGSAVMNAKTHQGEVPTAVCQTQGDASAPDGVKLLTGHLVPYDQLPHPVS